MQLHQEMSVVFMAGLLGSGHCIGMCGPLASAFFMRVAPGSRGAMPLAAYHGGRMLTYGVMGMLAALAGMALTSSGVVGKAQGILQILAGVLVILLGLDLLGLPWLRLRYDFWPMLRLRRWFMSAGDHGPVRGAWMGGVLNGLMPCSLTLAVAVKATTAGGVLSGGALMLAFGLGTLPSMIFVSVAFQRLGASLRQRLLQVAALFIIMLGLVTMAQGVAFFSVMWRLPSW
ncbi:MAG: sulfite exporter TauE/SafE family protein [Magnetococcus sp. WYHC-3]